MRRRWRRARQALADSLFKDGGEKLVTEMSDDELKREVVRKSPKARLKGMKRNSKKRCNLSPCGV